MALSSEPRLSPPTPPAPVVFSAGHDPYLRAAAFLFLGQAAVWGLLLFRWATFTLFNWTPLAAELALAAYSPLLTYALYGGLLVGSVVVGVGLLRDQGWARAAGLVLAGLTLAGVLVYYALTREFYGTLLVIGLAGMQLLLLTRHTAWSLAYPSALWLAVFFVAPLAIVFVVSLGERARLGGVTFPAFELGNLGVYFDNYVRVFQPVNGDFIYLRIFARSAGLALLNTVLCLLVGYPFAYWIARQPAHRRPILILLVMIPFWTNFLVRTYAWILILRDSGLINNVWTGSIHDIALQLSAASPAFSGLAEITARPLPLMFNLPAVLLGLFYGYLPFMVLPLYSNLERLNWSYLEAAADLGANRTQTFLRVLLPLSMPGIIAGSIIVFIPSLGAYVTPDLMGGARVSLLGNLLQQQFMTVRDWPFGSALSFIMMAVMLAATLVYFRVSAEAEKAEAEGGR
jgi:spermidine/putrescine transport system permease protein